MSDAYGSAEGARRTTNALMVGVITEIDRDAGTVRVEFEEDWISADLPWTEGGSGAFRTRHDPTVGEQVLVASPSGDPAQGLITHRIRSDAFPLPEAEEGETVLGEWDDEARDSYKAESHERTIEVPAGGKIVLKVGTSELVITDSSILLKSAAVDLGGTGGQPVGRVQDAVSISPPVIAAGSSRVKAT